MKARRRAGTRRVGVRELRQNLSVYLRQVKKGARLEVTEYGHPVALLAPLPRNHSWVERMIAEGQATRPEGDLLDLGPALPRKPGEPSLNHFLDELREDRV